jgi:hypothetical protein
MKEKTNSLESLDKRTCDTVMQDLSVCIDDWDKQKLDTEAAVLTLLKFTIDMAFSKVVNDNLEIEPYDMKDLELFFMGPGIAEKKIIH